MKKLFPGHFRPDETEIKQIWSEGLIALDANVLLNLYRYSDETREEFLKILKLFEDKLILPNWAAQEFFSNRLDVIVEQEKSYDETLGEIVKLEKKFANTRQHPFLSQGLLSRLARLFRDVTQELKKRQQRYFDQVHDDPLLLKLDQIFRDRILPGFTKERLLELGKEGQPRYSAKIPPGYMDERKSEDGDPLRKFGDFILWKELLEHCKEQKRSLIFVTDDQKEDWWQKVKGETLGPRPELIGEFREHSGHMFQMYLPDRFLEWASKQRGQEVKPAAISEVRELQSTSSVLANVRYLEGLNLLMDRANSDPRYAIKRSWELLGGTVLRRANVSGENVAPDSEDISISLNRLESDTKYPHDLILSIKRLQQIARKVFYHSQYAYDPSPKEAEEFVRSSAAARKGLGDKVE
jgi:hypothetical protein